MDAGTIVAVGIASLSLAWNVVSWVGDHRSRVKVSVFTEPVPLLEEELKLSVVIRNLGRGDESVERVGLDFREDDEDAEFGNGGVSEEVGETVATKHRYKWTWDLGTQRYRVGRRYRAVVTLGSGKTLRTNWESFDIGSLLAANLTGLVMPTPTHDEIDEAQRRLFPSSYKRAEEGEASKDPAEESGSQTETAPKPSSTPSEE